MSPSEFDLRAALRDGEGDDVPDVDRVLAEARTHGKQRRARLLSTVGAVVVVAAAAAGSVLVFGGDGSQHAADPKRSGPAATITSAPGNGTSSPAPGSSTSAAAACPAAAPRPIDPPGVRPTTSPKRFMFTAPVRTLLVCSYTDAAAPEQVKLTGSAATAITDSIESASADRLKIPCPDITTGQRTLLALVPITSDGTTLPTVVTDISIPDCNEPITNGSAVRYNWRPPAALAARLAAPR